MKFLTVMILCLFSLSGYSEAKKYIDCQQFLGFKPDARVGWFIGTISALRMAASLHEGREASSCVGNWFFEDPEKRQAQMEKIYAQNLEKSPTILLMFQLNQACGVFDMHPEEVKGS